MERLSTSDLYAVLGVDRDASAPEIRHAFRRLARRHHPDANPNEDGAAKFTTVATAYEILYDPTKRSRYDRATTPAARSEQAPAAGRNRRPSVAATQVDRHGVLELSTAETHQLAHQPLKLTDAAGRTILIPAGTHDGDRITVRLASLTVELTVRTVS